MTLPLSGIRVLDLTNVLAGPYCSMVLGDMGAEVIKIENADKGDISRSFEPQVNAESYCFAVLNRNKKSVALNLKDPDGLKIAQMLFVYSTTSKHITTTVVLNSVSLIRQTYIARNLRSILLI